jgi:hypothetical protein
MWEIKELVDVYCCQPWSAATKEAVDSLIDPRTRHLAAVELIMFWELVVSDYSYWYSIYQNCCSTGTELDSASGSGGRRRSAST